MISILSVEEYVGCLADKAQLEQFNSFTSQPFVAVDFTNANTASLLNADFTELPAVPVIGINCNQELELVDLCCEEEQLKHLSQQITAQPLASATLVQLLRHNAVNDIQQGLFAESLAYSTLQHSAGFESWLGSQPTPKTSTSTDQPVLLDRTQQTLTITFNRADKHNAYNAAMRDGLCEGLLLAHADGTIANLHLQGNGPSFCSGGDLTEFGLSRDGGVAHISRTTRSAAWLIHSLNCTTQVSLHGACIGAGIELSAFANTLTATADAYFQLPEVGFGLVPGAGGTVSILHRIGRHKTAWLALTGQSISAETAFKWRLIDHIF